MADRGRRARPISSRLCDQKYQDYCDKLHKERIAGMKGRSDHSRPKSMDFKHMQTGNNVKKNYLETQRLNKIHLENTRLLDKMEEINQTKIEFKPWRARSSLGFKAGYYYDSHTAQAVTDHHLRLLPSQPRGGTSAFARKTEVIHIMKENHKILDAIQRGKPQIRFDKFEKDHDRNTQYINRLSMYYGPETARFTSSWRSQSARGVGRASGVGSSSIPSTSTTAYYRNMLNFRPRTAPNADMGGAPPPSALLARRPTFPHRAPPKISLPLPPTAHPDPPATETPTPLAESDAPASNEADLGETEREGGGEQEEES
eukprot:CAMPEP_0177793944 /NCGR_PEP_ID=MMETSP0491_2-20121128/25365_1 /TAXON_ID=63592 /ORGANISM="Tetraselmis chuii, Strain PLY429" /LENGTH=314 /DNA_ID=CAMNT_0019316533 /DNA_START=193 /DNA_END=1138 /DNA_ORIENTATION=+